MTLVLPPRSAKPRTRGITSMIDFGPAWFDRLLIEADPYRFPQQHAELVKTFGPEVNLANITPGQVLRLEGFRRGIGRAVDYSIIAR